MIARDLLEGQISRVAASLYRLQDWNKSVIIIEPSNKNWRLDYWKTWANWILGNKHCFEGFPESFLTTIIGILVSGLLMETGKKRTSTLIVAKPETKKEKMPCDFEPSLLFESVSSNASGEKGWNYLWRTPIWDLMKEIKKSDGQKFYLLRWKWKKLFFRRLFYGMQPMKEILLYAGVSYTVAESNGQISRNHLKWGARQITMAVNSWKLPSEMP